MSRPEIAAASCVREAADALNKAIIAAVDRHNLRVEIFLPGLEKCLLKDPSDVSRFINQKGVSCRIMEEL